MNIWRSGSLYRDSRSGEWEQRPIHWPGIVAGLALLQYQPVGNLECLRGGDRKIEMCLLVETLRVPEADMSKRKVLLGLIGTNIMGSLSSTLFADAFVAAVVYLPTQEYRSGPLL